ncbi:MAG: MEDS domain-containing protein [Actinobacteria bacterium]|nr:MEDS domain-containing protein [Actinomycetota bacterium]
MARSWDQFLRGSATAEHAVQIYSDLDELANSVADYLAAGFEAGDPAVVVAVPEHWSRFEERLQLTGCDVHAIEEQGLLVVVDAQATLAEIMDGGDAPSSAVFERVIGGLLDQVAERFPGRQIRAFGEMVNLLAEAGSTHAAIRLEELWNAAAETRAFSLLCGYHLSLFDRAAQTGALPQICRQHSHVQPAADRARLAQAVDLALEEVLGYERAGRVYFMIGQESRDERVPLAQLVLMWVSKNMPTTADRILSSARARYFGELITAPKL